MRRSDMAKGIGAYANRPGYFLGGMVGGAILGALVNKIQGKDPTRGAIFGGITGGLGGAFLKPGGFGAKYISGMKDGFGKTLLQMAAANPFKAATLGGGAMSYLAGDPEADRKKQEEAMMAEMEARRKRNEEMYSGYYNNPFEGYMAGAARGGLMKYARGGFAAGGQKPEGIASLDEGKEMAGLTDSDKSELQMLQMLRIITPSNDPKYKQIEDQIQKLMDKMNLDKTAMSPPHPDAEYKQLMDNFILENPGMQFDSLEDFKEYYMENADFLPSDNAARGGYKKLSYGGMTGNTVEGVTEMDMTAGGATNGPGTGTSDSIPAMLSDGEFVVTAKAVENLGGGNRMLGAKRMYQMMNSLDPNSQTPAEMMTAGRV